MLTFVNIQQALWRNSHGMRVWINHSIKCVKTENSEGSGNFLNTSRQHLIDAISQLQKGVF
jgi:hypothetical protein